MHLLVEGQFCTAVNLYFGVFRHNISRIKKSKEIIMKMGSNHDATFEDVFKCKQKHKYLTIEEMLKVIHMLEKGQSCTAIARHFGVSRNTNTRIRKLEERVRMTGDFSFNISIYKLFLPIISRIFLWKLHWSHGWSIAHRKPSFLMRKLSQRGI